ncbi:MAG: KipI antagonist [Saprospiraceae bacterium]|nr:KipI antagonist [Saprospiraceae bacterium]
MKIRIITPGLLATVQDLGRPQWRSDGVPLGGAADAVSHRIANFLVGNKAGAATLEIAGGRFTAQVEQPGWLAVAGADGQFLTDEKEVGFGRLVFAPNGASLDIRPGSGCNYAYLAVSGGWDVPEVLNSKSTCLAAGFGGWEGRVLRKGDVLSAADAPPESEMQGGLQHESVRSSNWFAGNPFFRKMMTPGSRTIVIRVLAGPEIHWWSETQQEQFFKTPFTVSARRDRMGVRLDAEDAVFGKTEIMLSTAVCPGAIQVPPDGHPFVLLADAQTTGGYPRIAQVIAVDIPRLVQIPPGQGVCFQKVTLEEAERLFFEQENMLQKIQLALRWRALK